MGAKILPMKKKKNLEPVLDKSGHRVPYFFKSRFTGEIFYRRELKKIKVPAIFETTGETTLGRAKTKADLILQQHINRAKGISDDHVFGVRDGCSVASVVDEILKRVTPKTRANTQAKHRIIFGYIKARFGSMNIKTLSLDDFEAWIEDVKKEGNRTTFMDFSKHMNLLFTYAYGKKYVSHLLRFTNPDSDPVPGRRFTDAEISDLWREMNDDTRDQFVLSYECFMRLREALHLTWDRVDLETGIIRLRKEDVKTGSKTGRGRSFVMSEHALKRMRARDLRIKSISPTYVFPGKGQKHKKLNPDKPMNDNKSAWKVAKRDAKITGRARWHDLRHTALSKALLTERRDPIAVSLYAGVSMATIEKVYLHDEAEDTKDVANSVNIT